MTTPVRVALIGIGNFGRHRIAQMLQQQDTTHIVATCDPSEVEVATSRKLFKEAGLKAPPNVPNLGELLSKYGKKLDVVSIATPHAYHHDQAKQCLEAGLDVLLEKPMVMNEAEANSLIATRDRTKKLLVVAFQGSLSPQVRKASAMLRAGECGPIQNISATVWQGWDELTSGTWRQKPALSGGGFLFDTGAHMLNTVSDLAGEDFAEIAAWLDNRGRAVDIRGTVMGRLRSGALVTMNGCGDAIPGHYSEILVFCEKATLRTGIWGEYLEMQKHGATRLRKVTLPPSLGAWEQFLAVRDGKMANPSAPEVGLRMARLWDAIRASAAKGGKPVKL